MVEILEEEEQVTWDMVCYWAHNLNAVAREIMFDRYAQRFDHGPPAFPPDIEDKDWYFEEYEDTVRAACAPRPFTVVGYWDEEQQRFCTSVNARTPLEAECCVLEEYEDADLCIVAVFREERISEDAYYAVHVSSTSNPPTLN